MTLQNYRDVFLQCLKKLKMLTGDGEEYHYFRWQAIYLTRGHFSYFFRGGFEDAISDASAQQIDMLTGRISFIPAASVNLYGATFGLNEAITAYEGPHRSVIDVAHNFQKNDAIYFHPEFFYIRLNIMYKNSEHSWSTRQSCRLRENTNLIFVGLEDKNSVDKIQESALGHCVAKEKPMLSDKWYSERFYYT